MRAQNRCYRSHFFEISDGEPRRAGQTGTIGSDSKPVLGHVDSLADYRTQADSLGILLARAGFGVILITGEGQFIYANDVAKTLLSSRRGLCCVHDRIVAVDTQANKKLHEIISGNSCRSGVLLKDKDSDEIYAIRVIPIVAKFIDRIEYSIVGLLIWPRGQGMADRVRIFSALFDLVPSETRVLAALISGKGVAYAARQLNITELTARTHLKHIMEKTDTHRQAELIRLLFARQSDHIN